MLRRRVSRNRRRERPARSVYLTIPGGDALEVYERNERNKTTLKHLGTVTGFNVPSGVAANDEMVLVTNSGNNTVSVVDPATMEITSVIKKGIGKRPVDVSFVQESDAAGRGRPAALYAVVANAGSDNVSIVDLVKGRGIKKIKVKDEPTDIFATVRWAGVKNSGDDSVSVINLDRAIPGRRVASRDRRLPPIPKVQHADTPAQTTAFEAVGWPTRHNDAALFVYTGNMTPFPTRQRDAGQGLGFSQITVIVARVQEQVLYRTGIYLDPNLVLFLLKMGVLTPVEYETSSGRLPTICAVPGIVATRSDGAGDTPATFSGGGITFNRNDDRLLWVAAKTAGKIFGGFGTLTALTFRLAQGPNFAKAIKKSGSADVDQPAGTFFANGISPRAAVPDTKAEDEDPFCRTLEAARSLQELRRAGHKPWAPFSIR